MFHRLLVQVCNATHADPVLGKVIHYLRSGWPVKVPDTLKLYFSHHDELSIEKGCIIWGIRVVNYSHLAQVVA